MTIQILGPGCSRCKLLEQNARAAVAEMGIQAAIGKVTDIDGIMEMGVMMTPALAVEGVVKSTGKVLTKDEIIQILKGGISGGR